MTPDRKEGSVLIMFLLVFAVAVYLILESGKYLLVDYEGAAGQRLLASGGSLLHSGVFVAQELLLEDLRKGGGAADHRFDNWAHAGRFYERLSHNLDSGDLQGEIFAEDGKIPLNSLLADNGVGEANGQILVRLLSALLAAHGIDGNPAFFLTSIRIWLGQKDTQNDAEWYASRDPSYAARKGKFISPGELRLVRWKGLEDEERMKILDGARGIPGLLQFVRIWGGKTINVNTAPDAVVAAMCPNAELRSEFVSEVELYRSNGANQFSGNWHVDIAKRLGVDMGKFPSKALGTTSSSFRIALTAIVGAGSIHSTTIVQRESQRLVVLFENIH